MSDDTWAAVDDYLEGIFSTSDPALDAALAASEAAGLPPIAVSPLQGRFLHLLARSIGARSILEIGTLGGYSTIWLARAVPPEGRVVTLERESLHVEVARRNLAGAGVLDRVEVREGDADETLDRMIVAGDGPFDFVFVDADKERLADYFERCMRLVRRGALLVFDNVVREGAVLDAASADSRVLGVRRFNERIKDDRRVVATTLQTVGAKGYDGMTVALVGD